MLYDGMNKAKVIAVTSVKGGTGKTTTVLNLAGIYAGENKKVLIIDLDLFASSISAMLNLNPTNDIYSMTDDMNNNRYEDFENYVTKYNENLHIISAPKDVRTANKVDARFIPIIISKASLKYDVILIDTNYFINDINVTVLENSDEILYVITNDAIDLKNMRSMVAIYKDMGVTNYRILLNESIFKGRHKYSEYDVNRFIKRDIDYHITDKFHIKDIDNYIYDGKILTMDKKIRNNYKRIISDIKLIADELITNRK